MKNSANICIGIHLVLIGGMNGYSTTCPASGHWKIRSKWLCNIIDKYACIYDANNQINTEKCDGPIPYGKGYKAVLRWNIDRILCSHARFQPFAFSTAFNSECVFLKSVCSGEGQIVIKNGLTFEDRICGCDYRKGYAFINTPIHFVYCKPSEEDCSCYKVSCPLEQPYLSKDYKCIANENVDMTVLTDATILVTEAMNNKSINKGNARKGVQTISFQRLIVKILNIGVILCIAVFIYALLTILSRRKTCDVNGELVKSFKPRSGLWSGWFKRYGKKHKFAIKLECDNGQINGSGVDLIDNYVITGIWNYHNGTCEFLKHYNEMNYDVNYNGKLSRDSRRMSGRYIVAEQDRSGRFSMSLSSSDETK